MTFAISTYHTTPRLADAYLYSPLGEMQLTFTPSDDCHVEVFARHLSSIPDTQDNQGINDIGIRYKVRLK